MNDVVVGLPPPSSLSRPRLEQLRQSAWRKPPSRLAWPSLSLLSRLSLSRSFRARPRHLSLSAGRRGRSSPIPAPCSIVRKLFWDVEHNYTYIVSRSGVLLPSFHFGFSDTECQTSSGTYKYRHSSIIGERRLRNLRSKGCVFVSRVLICAATVAALASLRCIFCNRRGNRQRLSLKGVRVQVIQPETTYVSYERDQTRNILPYRGTI